LKLLLTSILASMVGLTIGIVITVLTVLSFNLSASYSPLLSFIASTSNLDSKSAVWLLLMLHDCAIQLFFAIIAVGLLWLLFKYYSELALKPSVKWLSAFMIQLPITGQIMLSNGIPNQFDSVYQSAMSITSLVGCLSVLVVFKAVTTYSDRLIKLSHK
jgi:hypothetical protein